MVKLNPDDRAYEIWIYSNAKIKKIQKCFKGCICRARISNEVEKQSVPLQLLINYLIWEYFSNTQNVVIIFNYEFSCSITLILLRLRPLIISSTTPSLCQWIFCIQWHNVFTFSINSMKQIFTCQLITFVFFLQHRKQDLAKSMLFLQFPDVYKDSEYS